MVTFASEEMKRKKSICMHVVVVVIADGAIQFLLNHIVTNSDASTYDAFTRAPVRSANSIVLAADEDDVTGAQQNFCCKT